MASLKRAPPTGTPTLARPAAKRPAPAGAAAAAASTKPAPPLDMLPYQRRLTFRRPAHASLEDRLRDLLGTCAPTPVGGLTNGGSAASDAPPPSPRPLRVVMSVGRIVARGTAREVVLPVRTEALLDGNAHEFKALLPKGVAGSLTDRLAKELEAWQNGPVKRWARVTVTEGVSAAPSAPKAEAVVYCPGSSFHYRLRVLSQAEEGPEAEAAEQTPEVVYTFVKEERTPADTPWWTVTLRSDSSGEEAVELSLNPHLLWSQCQRMKVGKQHAFSVLLRDFLRNARSVVAFLSAAEARGAAAPCFYPGLLEPTDQVKEFYEQKAQSISAQKAQSVTAGAPQGAAAQPGAAATAQQAGGAKRMAAPPKAVAKPSLSEKVRRYNNLIKVIEIEKFVDDMSPSVRILDLGCGRGQDINKYSRKFRAVEITKYIGVDFAEAAVEEARRRQHALHQRGENEYPAEFHSGDLRSDETFAKLQAGGHTCFDVVSIQFTLHYLASSEEAMRTFLKRIHGLLRPGGRVIASIPNSDSLSNLYVRGLEEHGLDSGDGMKVGNRLYNVCFQGDVWKGLGADEDELDEAFGRKWGSPYDFTLVDAVEAQTEYIIPWQAFSEMVEEIGFTVHMDGTFSELFESYSKQSKFFNGIFSKDPENAGPLSAEEQELFEFYSGFCLIRT